MSPGLVIVLGVAAGVPLLLGLLPALRVPGALLEIVVGVLIGPSVLGWVTPDATVEAIAHQRPDPRPHRADRPTGHAGHRARLPGRPAPVRALPALAFHRELDRRELIAVGLLQATSLPFLLAAVEIGREMRLLAPAVGPGLVAAGLVSVLIFPAAALALLPRRVPVPA